MRKTLLLLCLLQCCELSTAQNKFKTIVADSTNTRALTSSGTANLNIAVIDSEAVGYLSATTISNTRLTSDTISTRALTSSGTSNLNIAIVDSEAVGYLSATTISNTRLTSDTISTRALNVSGGLYTSTNKLILSDGQTGDIYYYDASAGYLKRLPAGTAGQALRMVSGIPAWRDTVAGGGAMTHQQIVDTLNDNGSTLNTFPLSDGSVKVLDPTLYKLYNGSGVETMNFDQAIFGNNEDNISPSIVDNNDAIYFQGGSTSGIEIYSNDLTLYNHTTENDIFHISSSAAEFFSPVKSNSFGSYTGDKTLLSSAGGALTVNSGTSSAILILDNGIGDTYLKTNLFDVREVDGDQVLYLSLPSGMQVYTGISSTGVISGDSIRSANGLRIGNGNIAAGDESYIHYEGGGTSFFAGLNSGIYNGIDTGLHNTGIGNNALGTNENGGYNVAVGAYALVASNLQAYDNSQNAVVGAYAMYDAYGDENTFIGSGVGQSMYGDKNIGVGAGGTANDLLGSNNILIGYDIDPPTGQDTLIIGDLIYGNTVSPKFVAVDGTLHATKFYVSSLNTAPANASDTGTAGEIRFASDGYLYLCTATDTWKRVQLATW